MSLSGRHYLRVYTPHVDELLSQIRTKVRLRESYNLASLMESGNLSTLMVPAK